MVGIPEAPINEMQSFGHSSKSRTVACKTNNTILYLSPYFEEQSTTTEPSTTSTPNLYQVPVDRQQKEQQNSISVRSNQMTRYYACVGHVVALVQGTLFQQLPLLVSAVRATRLENNGVRAINKFPLQTADKGSSSPNNKINEKQHPYMAVASMRDEHGRLLRTCSATLVSPNVVLSAANCRHWTTIGDTIMVGRTNLDDGLERDFETFSIVDKAVHPEFHLEKLENDCMLFKLNGSSKFDPVTLDDGKTTSFDASKSNLVVLSWGSNINSNNNHGNNATASLLTEIPNFYVNPNDCNQIYGGGGGKNNNNANAMLITPQMVCASYALNGDACDGDSGAPLFDKMSSSQVGIVSWGTSCTQQQRQRSRNNNNDNDGAIPAVYTRVSEVHEWIHSMIERWKPTSKSAASSSGSNMNMPVPIIDVDAHQSESASDSSSTTIIEREGNNNKDKDKDNEGAEGLLPVMLFIIVGVIVTIPLAFYIAKSVRSKSDRQRQERASELLDSSNHISRKGSDREHTWSKTMQSSMQDVDFDGPDSTHSVESSRLAAAPKKGRRIVRNDSNSEYISTRHHPARRSRDKIARKSTSSFVSDRSSQGLPPEAKLRESMSDSTVEILLGALKKVQLFESYTNDELDSILDCMKPVEQFANGEFVYVEGDIGSELFIVETGETSFTVNTKEVGKARAGDAFGDECLIYEYPRTFTCKVSAEGTTLWRLARMNFRRVQNINANFRIEKILDVLGKIQLLSALDPNSLKRLARTMTRETFEEGTAIIRKGEEGDKFYIISEGKAAVSGVDQEGIVIQEEGFFGERALLSGDTRNATITALTKCTMLTLAREDFNQLLGSVDDLRGNLIRQGIIAEIPLYVDTQLSHSEMHALVKLSATTTFHEDDTFHGGTEVLTFLSTCSCLLALDSSVKEVEYHKGDSVTGNEVLRFKNECECLLISLANIERSIKRGVARLTPGGMEKLPLVISDINKIDMIHSGESYTKIWTASTQKFGTKLHPNKIYILKEADKYQLLKNELVHNIWWEKGVLEMVESPFIINLLDTFQSKETLYMLFNFVDGGNLQGFIEECPSAQLSVNSAQFFAACMVEAIAHLQMRNISHRDITPESFVVGSDGYCILIDFDNAKMVDYLTFTMCGRPQYMAPEIVEAKGHDMGVDMWSFGITLYEMLTGQLPFDAMTQLELFKLISKRQFDTAKLREIAEGAEDLLTGLLSNRMKRLGMLAGGIDDIREHTFFESMDWDKLLWKQMIAPHASNSDQNGNIVVGKYRAKPLEESLVDNDFDDMSVSSDDLIVMFEGF